MYIWKRWRDTEIPFFLSLAFSLMLTNSFSLWSREDVLLNIVRLWTGLATPIGIFVGLFIGSRSIGTDIGGGSGDFTVTRPRSRRYFIWMGWAVGVIEIFVVLAITTLYAAGVLFHEDGSFWRHLPATAQFGQQQLVVVDIPLLIASVTVFTIVVYSAVYLASVLTRRSGVAAIVAFGFIGAYQVIGNRLGWGYNHLPELLVTPYYEVSPHHFEYMHATAIHGLIAWIICAFLFPFVAQLVFERSEI
jgi:hypothetical protein